MPKKCNNKDNTVKASVEFEKPSKVVRQEESSQSRLDWMGDGGGSEKANGMGTYVYCRLLQISMQAS